MRWWKTYRDDLERPSISIGLERFGLDFFYDVACVWSLLCIENGPGVRRVELSDHVVRILGRKFRVKPHEALERIRYMADAGLVDITSINGVQMLGSAEIERRRDEWSARRHTKNNPSSEANAPEPLLSHSGVTPDTELRGQRSKSRDQRTEANDVTSDEGDVTSEGTCCLKVKTPWEFAGLDTDKIPARFKKGKFSELFQAEYEKFKDTSHEDGQCYCFVDEFIGSVRDACGRVGVEYPKALLKRQTEIEKLDRTLHRARAS
jgi:hypothetical protein